MLDKAKVNNYVRNNTNDCGCVFMRGSGRLSNIKVNTMNRIKLKLYRGNWKAPSGKILLPNEVRLLVAMGYKFEPDARG